MKKMLASLIAAAFLLGGSAMAATATKTAAHHAVKVKTTASKSTKPLAKKTAMKSTKKPMAKKK